jgi:ribose transport system substrate-binding protein
MKRRTFTQACLALPLLTAACKSNSASGNATRIAVIPKGASAEFWKSIHAGAVKAAQETGVEIIWKGPLKDDDLKAQIDVVQSFVAQGVSGITLCPLSETGLASVVHQAVESKIPVLVMDSDLKGTEHISFIATDNYKGGQMGGEALAKLLGGKGNVLMLRYVEGSASTAKREQGFLDVMKQNPGIKVVSENQYGGATTEAAYQASENLLAATKATQGGIDGIFCVAEATTLGMLLALQKVGLAGKLKFVGFDVSNKLLDAVKAGTIDGLIVQNPFMMGYLGVKNMNAHLKGEKIERVVDTGVHLVTKENMDQPDIKELVQPDLKKWLKE